MPGALDGTRVLDLSRLLPGPYCTMLMADLGADVVKIEDPQLGDYIRNLPPFIDGVGSRYLALNRNKKSATLNLKTPRGHELFLKLIERYDIVVEGFRPGVMDRLGVGFETASKINPKIIYCSLSGYGSTGPYAERAGHDINYIGYSGVLGLTGQRGDRPTLPGVQVGDIVGAMSALVGIMAALVSRCSTGKGQAVDVSLADSAFAMLPMVLSELQAGDPQARGETTLTGGVPYYNTYETSDGKFVCIGAIEPKFFKRFCELTGRMDFVGNQLGTGKQRDKFENDLKELFLTKARQEWLDLLEADEVCFGPVNSVEEAMQDPQLVSRGVVIENETGKGGKMKQTGHGFKMSGTPADFHAAPPPDYGEHTAEILGEIGVTTDDLAALRKDGVIR